MLRSMAETDGPGDFAGFEGLDGGEGSSIERARTEAIERLKRHAAPGGALSAAELADRVRRVYLAQTRVGIDQVLADLPADPPWSLAPGLPPVPGQAPAVRQRRPPTTPWRRLGFVLGALVLLVGVGAAAVVASTGDDEDAGEPDEEEADGPARQLPESTLPPLAVPEAPATTEPPATTTVPTTAPDLGIGYVEPEFVLQKVGQDIAAGRYLSTPELTCYWERVKSFGGTLNDVIANGGSLSGQHVIVDVLASDAGLRSQGCDFRPYAPPPTPATTFADGDWLVGSDIAPGTYRLTQPLGGEALMCAWERATDFTFGLEGDIIDYAYPAAPDPSVQVQAGERFTSMTCGTWTRA
jgi:hypothetical protein